MIPEEHSNSQIENKLTTAWFKKKKINRKKFQYIDDVLSLNNSKFGDYVERIYPIELEIKSTTDTVKSVAYLDYI